MFRLRILPPTFCKCCYRYASSHYDVLGLTPSATQADIKSAYYRLSMLYHPDKSQDIKSEKKFRAITEAYEVLGNVNLKKFYDKGLIVKGHTSIVKEHVRRPKEPDDPKLKFYKSHEKRATVPTMDGRTPIYDFDEWSKNHYGEVFAKQKKARATVEFRKVMAEKSKDAEFTEHSLFVGVLTLMLFVCFYGYGASDYDIPKRKEVLDAKINDGK